MTLLFERDIRPRFRERDRESMKRHFDLWSVDDVRAHASTILSVLEQGRMPCDQTWPNSNLETLRQWIESDMAP